MTLDVRSAAVVLECARKGSLGGAAAALNMTQPAITRMLQRLEASYGVSLFERTTRGVIPTIFGEALLPYAKLIVSEAAGAGDVINEMRGASRGVVRVGGVGSVSGFIVAAVAEMQMRYPDVQYQIIEDLEDRILDALKHGDIDIAISPEAYLDDDIALAVPEMLRDVVAVFGRAGHPLADEDAVSLEVAAGLKWAMPPRGAPTTKEFQRRFQERFLEPKAPVITSRSKQVIKLAVLEQGLYCWMPKPLMRGELERHEVVPVPVTDLQWRRTFRIYRRRRGLLRPSAAALLQAISTVCGRWNSEIR